MYTLGVNPTDVLIPSNIETGGTLLALGTRAVNQDGKEFILLLSAAAITVQGVCGCWDANFTFIPVQTGGVGTVGGRPVAFSRGLPTAAGQRFWAQRYGQGTVRVIAATAANVLLATSATVGVLDDVLAANFAVLGVTLTATAGGAQESTNAVISYPVLGEVLGG